jgi:hypothetical protein
MNFHRTTHRYFPEEIVLFIVIAVGNSTEANKSQIDHIKVQRNETEFFSWSDVRYDLFDFWNKKR